MERANTLLQAMPADVLARLAPRMATVPMPNGMILHRPGAAIRHVYFPLDCMISVTVTMRDGHTVEAGIVGSREMAGIDAFMGGRQTNQTEYIVQIPGTAVCMEAAALLEEFDRVKALRDVMLRYTQAYLAHLSQNVACNRLHAVERRLSRWLLECRDRLRSDDLRLTHEFAGQMLGCHRPVVSETLALLRGRGLIAYGRGQIQVADAAGLEAAACECYAVVRDEYNRLLGVGEAGKG